ncbi:MAG: hypothetical protein LPH21_12595 [Shewanella sp.]|nr:hypothetical protein [Shewanella sp.]
MTTYEAIRKELKTGDLVLFSGKSMLARCSQLVTRSPWTHVGMVLTMPTYDSVCLWESNYWPSVRDQESSKFVHGVQIVSLRERLLQFDGIVAVRRLVDVNFDDDQISSLFQLKREIGNNAYEKSPKRLINALVKRETKRRLLRGDISILLPFIPFDNTEDLSTVAGPELVAEAYQRLGLLSESQPSDDYLACDFGGAQKMALLHGKLCPELIIERPDP